MPINYLAGQLSGLDLGGYRVSPATPGGLGTVSSARGIGMLDQRMSDAGRSCSCTSGGSCGETWCYSCSGTVCHVHED